MIRMKKNKINKNIADKEYKLNWSKPIKNI